MNPNHNPMSDFKPVFHEIRAQIKSYAAFSKAWKQVRKLKPGETMEARVAARTAAQNAVNAQHSQQWFCGINRLLTAHCHLRGKAANHGFTADEAAGVTERVVAQIRKELAARVPVEVSV